MRGHAQLTAREIHGPYVQLLTNLQGENGSEWLEALNLFLRKENPWEKPKLFAAGSLISVGPLTERFDPKSFFKTRKGLYLWNDMSRVLEHATSTEAADAATLGYANLTRNAYDREIKAELPETHEVELWQIANLIEVQKNGEAGPLLTNGYANIFYCGGFVVYLRWDADSARWRVYDWKLDDEDWRAGNRVFSRN